MEKTMYRVSTFGKPEKIIVVKETPSSVWVKGEAHSIRKETSMEVIKNTIEEAKAWRLAEVHRKIEKAKHNLKYYENALIDTIKELEEWDI